MKNGMKRVDKRQIYHEAKPSATFNLKTFKFLIQHELAGWCLDCMYQLANRSDACMP